MVGGFNMNDKLFGILEDIEKSEDAVSEAYAIYRSACFDRDEEFKKIVEYMINTPELIKYLKIDVAKMRRAAYKTNKN